MLGEAFARTLILPKSDSRRRLLFHEVTANQLSREKFRFVAAVPIRPLDVLVGQKTVWGNFALKEQASFGFESRLAAWTRLAADTFAHRLLLAPFVAIVLSTIYHTQGE